MNTQNKNVLLGICSYLGVLLIIPFLVAKDDPFVKFHLKQGTVLLVIEIIVWFLRMALWSLWPLLGIIKLGVFILSIVGIINVIQKKEKELPLVGQFSKYFKF